MPSYTTWIDFAKTTRGCVLPRVRCGSIATVQPLFIHWLAKTIYPKHALHGNIRHLMFACFHEEN